MSARSAMSSIEAAWKPRSAKTSPATSSICSSRTARGTSRVPARRFSDRAMRQDYFGVGSVRRLTLACFDVTSFGDTLKTMTAPTLLATAFAAVPAAGSEPAGGAALGEVAIATGMATAVTALLLWLCAGHRSGRVRWLGAAADLAHRV